MALEYGLVLGFAGGGILLGALALTRSLPARLRSECEEARRQAMRAQADVEALKTEWTATRSELHGLLEQMIEERERATKDRVRARAERQRAEQGPGNGPPIAESRHEKLARLRRESGILGGV